jgi:EpsI family protein
MDMIGNTAIRIGIVAAAVVTAWLVCHGVGVSLKPPPVELPDWTFHDLPLQIGDWRGEHTKLDDAVAVKTGAVMSSIEERAYRDDLGHTISVYMAMFEDPDAGVYHIPSNCQRRAGWQEVDEYRETLQVSDELSIPVLVTTWEHENEHLIVVYWLQLGDRVLFDRADMGRARWSLRGRATWPALLKVQLSMPAAGFDDAKPVILDFAKEIAAWENKPAHHTAVAEAAARAAGAAANASP